MNERKWRALLNQFDICVREEDGRFFNTSKVLRYQGEDIQGLYLNRSRAGLTYLTALQKDEDCYPDRLWDRIDTGRLKKKDWPHVNSAPKPDMEKKAMKTLLRCLGLV